jgi:hypothetical protein
LRKPTRAAERWTQPELDRLREVYLLEGLAGCLREFPERT